MDLHPTQDQKKETIGTTLKEDEEDIENTTQPRNAN